MINKGNLLLHWKLNKRRKNPSFQRKNKLPLHPHLAKPLQNSAQLLMDEMFADFMRVLDINQFIKAKVTNQLFLYFYLFFKEFKKEKNMFKRLIRKRKLMYKKNKWRKFLKLAAAKSEKLTREEYLERLYNYKMPEGASLLFINRWRHYEKRLANYYWLSPKIYCDSFVVKNDHLDNFHKDRNFDQLLKNNQSRRLNSLLPGNSVFGLNRYAFFSQQCKKISCDKVKTLFTKTAFDRINNLINY